MKWYTLQERPIEREYERGLVAWRHTNPKDQRYFYWFVDYPMLSKEVIENSATAIQKPMLWIPATELYESIPEDNIVPDCPDWNLACEEYQSKWCLNHRKLEATLPK